MTILGDSPLPHQPVVGVVGPVDLVEHIIELGVGLTAAKMDVRLVGVAYGDEQEIPRELARVQPELDACLFAGPLPHDVARAAGVLAVPATAIPLSGSALFGTLLRARLEHGVDLGRVSIDSVSEEEACEAYADVHLPTDGIKVCEYDGPESAGAFEEFHRRHWAAGDTALALTSVRSVAQRLAAADVPVLLMRPTTATIRSALRTAALLGIGSRLEEAQIAIGIIELPRAAPADPSRDELRLAVHRILLSEARRMGATILPNGDTTFYVIATLGSLVAITDELAEPAFVRRVREEVGLDVELGIGLGVTAQAAEGNARKALVQARSEGQHACIVGHTGTRLMLPAYPKIRQDARDEARERAKLTLHRLVDALRADTGREGDPLVVDAGAVADVLDVTPRAARRVLVGLAETGLAWQMPPARSSGPGRPRQTYRLLAEQLG